MANLGSRQPAGILVALPEELATLSRRRPGRGECLALDADRLLVLAGAGPENAERAARLLLDRGAGRLISWGCAAALAPALNPGALLLPEQVRGADGQIYPTCGTWLHGIRRQLPAELPVIGGTLAESRHIVADSREKQQLYAATGAVALDMESAGLCRVAAAAGVPAVVVRTVADPAGMNLPQAVVRALNASGDVELPRLLRYLAIHPGELPALLRLGRHFQAARKTLQAVAASGIFQPGPADGNRPD